MAPEVFAGKDFGNDSDMFSLGLTLFEVITSGQQPFPDTVFVYFIFNIIFEKNFFTRVCLIVSFFHLWARAGDFVQCSWKQISNTTMTYNKTTVNSQ